MTFKPFVAVIGMEILLLTIFPNNNHRMTELPPMAPYSVPLETDSPLEKTIKEVKEVEAETTPAPVSKSEDFVYWKVTAYCPCRECSGGYGRQTATGKIAKAGRTVAVDPKVVKYGSKVIIDGHEYIAEDCGGAVKGYHIDIFFDTHQEVEEFGRQEKIVKVRRGREK